jgi:hypothetical protein
VTSQFRSFSPLQDVKTGQWANIIIESDVPTRLIDAIGDDSIEFRLKVNLLLLLLLFCNCVLRVCFALPIIIFGVVHRRRAATKKISRFCLPLN